MSWDGVWFRHPELFPPERLVDRESSLRSATFGSLRTGETLRLDVTDQERIAALMINTGAKGGTVAIRGGGNEAIKALTIYWRKNQPDIYSSILVDMAAPITGGPEGVTVEIVDKDRAPSEKTLEVKPTLPGRYGEIEIEGALITRTRSEQHAFSAPSYGDLPLNLGTLPEVDPAIEALSSLPYSFGRLARNYRLRIGRRIRRMLSS